ncbi:DUF1775 domain-containing protein [Ilumatobacter nonamiensis]|uniref:DUF1775 domain-containing protein n=1 Tax=Ilumatobacter nonamiensis TaxID=467093 RepID=UPI00034D7710|nr:DUF1775 domain-containing protein [Ilumatobacter nonamiensis]
MRIRTAAVVLFAAASTLLVASPALAHIDPDPSEAQAGSRLSVGFTVEHGCDGSATTSLDMRLPDGVTDATPEPPQGWEGSLADDVLTFVGGPLPADQELTFNVALTLPPTPDTIIYFPFVQRCEVGEIRWIDVPSDGSGDELDEPAPAMALFGPVATTTTTTVGPTTTVAAETTAAPTTSTSTSTTTTAPAVTDAPVDTVDADSSTTVVELAVDSNSEDGGGSGLLVVLGVGAAVIAAAAGGVFYLRRRPS